MLVANIKIEKPLKYQRRLGLEENKSSYNTMQTFDERF